MGDCILFAHETCLLDYLKSSSDHYGTAGLWTLVRGENASRNYYYIPLLITIIKYLVILEGKKTSDEQVKERFYLINECYFM